MTDSFDRDQAEYWFDRTCRYAELVGHIVGWASVKNPLTPEESVAQIRRLIEEFEAQNRRDEGGES